VTLTLRLIACAAVCALTLACSEDSAPSSPTPAPSATSAGLALVPTLPASVLPPTPAPAATSTPEAVAATAVAPPVATNAPAPAATPTSGARPAPVTLPVTLETAGQTFEPHQIHGNYDDTVTLTLHGSDERHSFTVAVLGLDQTIDKDKTVQLSFVLPLSLTGGTATPASEGIYPFYCRFHGSPTSGMHGFLILH
jgi:plastocyanin